MIIRGQKINDRYQIIRLIGEGGMANVYLAHDTILDRDVAVKVLRGDLADDEKFIRRFQREAISASSLNHPNIVEIYDVGEDDGNYYIVMEYVDGKTLKSLIKRRGSLTLPEVVDIMLQLTSAIACAHESFIIHRDIKPQNVLILDNGVVKITDFGIAMALNSNELTQTNSVMGSVHYLPPEQANGTGATMKSDIYSLGILMYETLTGKVPFKGENAVEIAIKQMKDEIPSITEEYPEIPQSIENIILRACAKNPDNRYNSVMEMHEDIEVALEPEHANDTRIKYEFPEHDFDETKKMPKISRTGSRTERNKENPEDKKDKKQTKMMYIAGGIFAALAFLLVFIFMIYPKIARKPDIKIPDVSGMTVVKAEETLQEKGFEVASKTESIYDEKIAKGKVVKTDPQKGRSVKKGTMITLIVSKGKNSVKVEDYTGENVYEIKAKLENKKINVIIETKEVTEDSSYKENIIISQSVEKGEKLKKGDSITLVVPAFITTYPDFVGESWSVANIESFCSKNGITLNKKTEETSAYPEGTVISQSRVAGTKVIANTPLTITVAKAPAKTPTKPETDNNTNNNDNSNTTTKPEQENTGDSSQTGQSS